MSDHAATWGIKVVHSCLEYWQLNGLADRMLKMAKNVLNVDLALLSLRNTPVTGTQFSPAQVLMGKVLTLVSTTAVLKPTIPEVFHSRLKHLQARQKHYYKIQNLCASSLWVPQFTISIRHGWVPTTVIKKRVEQHADNAQTSSSVT